jgi:hypothetical protein
MITIETENKEPELLQENLVVRSCPGVRFWCLLHVGPLSDDSCECNVVAGERGLPMVHMCWHLVISTMFLLMPVRGFLVGSHAMMRARHMHPASTDLHVRSLRHTPHKIVMAAPPSNKKSQPSDRKSDGMSEPWASLTKLLYYGAYVGVFGKMLVVIVERILSSNNLPV